MEIQESQWLKDYKFDDRPFIEGKFWGPGWYTCKCLGCGDKYLGEKRSNECADCAYST